MILHQVVGTDSTTDPGYSFDPILSSLCLVNRRWNGIFTPQLYAHYDFKNNADEFGSLWCFLRTLVTRPDIAQHVRQLTLHENLFPAFSLDGKKLRSIKDHYDGNSPWLETAFSQAGWNEPYINRSRWGLSLAQQDQNDVTLAEMARKVISNDFPSLVDKGHITTDNLYHKSYRFPLFALVIAHCPRLRRLSTPVHLVDPFLDEVLYWATYGATGPNRPKEIGLQELESLSLQREESFGCSPDTGFVVHSSRKPVCARPYYRLPQLKQLDTDETFKDRGVFDDVKKPYQSNIQELTALYPKEILSLPNGTLLSRISNLRSLSLSLAPCAMPASHSTIINHYSQFWNCLTHFRDTLEYLDIDTDTDLQHFIQTYGIQIPGEEDHPFCPPLAKFTKLKYLASTPLLLYGNRCQHEPPSKIPSHLPKSLVALGLYCELSMPDLLPGQPGGVTARRLFEEELIQILTAGSANGLRALIVDHTRSCFKDHNNSLESVALAGQQMGVKFICAARGPSLGLEKQPVPSYPLHGGGLDKSAFLWLDDREVNKVEEEESPWVGGADEIIPRGIKMYHKRESREDKEDNAGDRPSVLFLFFQVLIPLLLGYSLATYIHEF